MSPGPRLRRRTVWERLLDWYSPYMAREFLCGPQANLNGQIPAELLAKGEGEALHQVLDRLDSDAYL